MDSKVAIILPNYNMPEAADNIAMALKGTTNKHLVDQYDLYVVDNGSDLKEPAVSTTLMLPENCQTTGGFLAGIAAAKKSGIDYIAYCFMITSTKWYDYIGVTDAIHVFESEPNIVGYSPALTHDSTTAWDHMKTRKERADEGHPYLPFQRPTWMIDNICAFWRADWFDSIGWFDPKFTYAWGIDLETSYKARQQGRGIVIDDYWLVHKTTDIAYDMGRMNMSAIDRRLNASKEMDTVMRAKYGPEWSNKMREAYVTEDMR